MPLHDDGEKAHQQCMPMNMRNETGVYGLNSQQITLANAEPWPVWFAQKNQEIENKSISFVNTCTTIYYNKKSITYTETACLACDVVCWLMGDWSWCGWNVRCIIYSFLGEISQKTLKTVFFWKGHLRQFYSARFPDNGQYRLYGIGSQRCTASVLL